MIARRGVGLSVLVLVFAASDWLAAQAPPTKAPPPPGAKGAPPPAAKGAPPPTAKGAPPAAAKAPPGKGPKIPEPEDVSLETKDGVTLKATYYGGFNKKESVPVILIHGWEGTRGEYHTLALGLQAKGNAVIAPDLRGHGQSLVQKHADGTTKELDPEKFRQAELDAMVLDIEACKKFLMEKNNQGELNINALCVVGADFGCILALRWSALDLTAPPLLAFKQGQDVKAIVLLTPMQTFKGLNYREALSVPALRSELSMMIAAGKQDSKGSAEAKRLYNSLHNLHAKVNEDDPEEVKKKKDLFLVQPETSLTGTKLLGSGLPVALNVRNFIEFRLVNKMAEFPWTDRKRGAD